MTIENVAEVIAAIENHTALKLAGVEYPQRLHELERRWNQLGGMIELTRRLKLDRCLERWLEAHRTVLQREIEGE